MISKYGVFTMLASEADVGLELLRAHGGALRRSIVNSGKDERRAENGDERGADRVKRLREIQAAL